MIFLLSKLMLTWVLSLIALVAGRYIGRGNAKLPEATGKRILICLQVWAVTFIGYFVFGYMGLLLHWSESAQSGFAEFLLPIAAGAYFARQLMLLEIQRGKYTEPSPPTEDKSEAIVGLLTSDVRHHVEPIAQEQREAWSVRFMHWFNPYCCSTKFTQRLSASLLIIFLLSWGILLVITVPSEGEMRLEAWLIIFGVPIAAYLVPLTGLTILRKASKSEGRYLLSANILWAFLVIAWAYIDHWGYSFDFDFYLAVIVLPLIGVWLGFFLWKWSKAS